MRLGFVFVLAVLFTGCKTYDDLELTDGSSADGAPQDTDNQIVIPPVVDTGDTDTSVEPPVPVSIAGSWVDPFDNVYAFTLESLTITAPNDTSLFNLIEWDDADLWILSQNDAANRIYPGRYSRHEWVFFRDDLYLCLVTGTAETLSEAQNAGPADPTDPRYAGCDFGPWVKLEAKR